MLPELIKQNQLARIEEKKSMILDPNVSSALTKIELLAAKSSIGTMISHYQDLELSARASAMVVNLYRDLGIRADPEDLKYSAKRFVEILRDYYSNFTLEQVEKAFQLLMRGELDEYLPKDKHGSPDRSHYQSFSLEYVSKVLRAFESYNNKVWFKAVKSIPEPERVFSEEEKAEAMNSVRTDIIEKFQVFKKEGILSDFLAPSLVVKELHRNEFLSEICPVSDSDVRKSLYVVTNSKNLNAFEIEEIKKKYESGQFHIRHIAEAERLRDLRMIRKAFEENETIEFNG